MTTTKPNGRGEQKMMKTNIPKPFIVGLVAVLIGVAAVNCSGGGGGGGGVLPPGGGGGSTPTPTVAPTATPTPIPTYTVSGTISFTGAACDGVAGNCAATGPVGSTAVKLGAIPSLNGGDPVAPIFNATTNGSGAYSIASVPAGTYELEVAGGAGFTTLHVKVAVSANTTANGVISALNAGETNWFTQTNAYRTTNGKAVIGADELAMEADRAYAEYLAANIGSVCNPTCSAYGQFAAQYVAAGGLFGYSDSYRVGVSEANCPSFAQADPNQGPMLASSTAVYGGYGFRITGTPLGACAFSIVVATS